MQGFGFVLKENLSERTISLYTDGACRGNGHEGKNPSAYAFFIKWKGLERVGGEALFNKTNNQMEITAVIRGLHQIKSKNFPVVIYSDSSLIVNCLQQGWYRKWERNGWNKDGGLKNADLWKELLYEWRQFNFIKIQKVKGHAKNQYNNLVDQHCNDLMDQLIMEGNND